MSQSTRLFFTSFTVAASLFCISAMASQGNGEPTTPAPSPSPTYTGVPEVKFECKFEGGGDAGKGGGWVEKCRVEGQFFDYTDGQIGTGDRMKVICNDGDDDHDKTVYDDGLKTRFDRDDKTLILKGERRDNDRMPPVVTVFNIDQDDICRPVRDDQRKFSSQIEFTQEGNSFLIPGRCEFKCELPTALN